MSRAEISASSGPYPSAVTRSPPTPEGHSQEDLRAWVRALCDWAGTKPTTLAKRAALAPSTVNRFLNDPRTTWNVSANTIDALRRAATIIAAERSQQEDDSANGSVVGTREKHVALIPVAVIGRVEAGIFQEALEWEPADQYRVQIPVQSRYAHLPTVAIEVHGQSMNIYYPDGTIIVCVSFWALKREPRSGERVVVHRRGPGGYEATIKEYLVDPNGHVWLMPRSSDPNYQKGVYLGANDATHPIDDEVVVSLLIIGSYRPEPDLAASA